MTRERGNGRQPDVALLLPSLDGGGLERVTLNLAEGLVGEGLRVDLVVAWPHGAYAGRVPKGVRTVHLGAPRMLRALMPLRAYLRRERPRALLTGLDYANVIAIWARALAHVHTRVVVSVHKYFSLAVDHSPLLRERLLLRSAVRLAYPRAEAVVAVSEVTANDLAAAVRLPRSRICVIHNPVLTDELIAGRQAPLDHAWFDNAAPPVLVAAGRLTEQKDYPTLLRAFGRARRARRLRLVILGEGELQPQLEEITREEGIDGDVEFRGFVANPYPFMAKASLFVMSSAWEGLPTALVEALACGTPVVSTNCPAGPAEILENGRYGRLVPVGDAEALAAAILTSLDDRSDPGRLEARAREFAVDRAVDRYRKVLGV
jgi:glycosyltransferase involved in cell wall biosynthesis